MFTLGDHRLARAGSVSPQPPPGQVDSPSMRTLARSVNKTVNVFFLVALTSRQGTLEELHDDCLELRSGGNLFVVPFSAIAYVIIIE